MGVVPDVIKIDVEGAEGEVLRGSQNLLEKFHPIVFLSLHPWALDNFGDSKADLLSWIEQRGYNCSLLATAHEEHLKKTGRLVAPSIHCGVESRLA